MTNVFSYLNNISTDVSFINRLFVSSFIKHHKLSISDHSYLSCYSKADSAVVDNFLKILSETWKLNLENLVKLFEFVISPSDRIVTGAVYTPQSVRYTIIEQCLGGYTSEQLQRIRVCDIACGCGGFLMDVAEYIHKKTGKSFKDIFCDNIYGIDIQGYSIERTKILLSLLALMYGEDEVFDFNIIQADTLDFHSNEWDKRFSSFDVIVGNPPYVCSRNVSEETKAKMLRYEVSRSGHPDLYIPFFQIADEMLNDNGKLGYITMNCFFRTLNGRKLRQYFSSRQKDISIVDFRGYQVFKKKSTYTCLFFLNKGVTSDEVKYVTNTNSILNPQFSFDRISYSMLDDMTGWNLNENPKAEKIESIGIPLGKYCASRHGVATLSNKTYIFKPNIEDELYYYIEYDGVTFPIEKSICKDIVNSNKLNSDVDFNSIIEKIIYPYRLERNGKITVIDEVSMRSDYPETYKYLNAKKHDLAQRDKGKTEVYPTWYAYGRTQSLIMPRFKLFFPKLANRRINCVLKDDSNLLLYNGIAFVSDEKDKLVIVKRIIESSLFWSYIIKNSKPYSSNYYSLSGVDIKNFGIPDFSKEDISTLLSFDSKEEIDNWLGQFYQ